MPDQTSQAHRGWTLTCDGFDLLQLAGLCPLSQHRNRAAKPSGLVIPGLSSRRRYNGQIQMACDDSSACHTSTTPLLRSRRAPRVRCQVGLDYRPVQLVALHIHTYVDMATDPECYSPGAHVDSRERLAKAPPVSRVADWRWVEGGGAGY